MYLELLTNVNLVYSIILLTPLVVSLIALTIKNSTLRNSLSLSIISLYSIFVLSFLIFVPEITARVDLFSVVKDIGCVLALDGLSRIFLFVIIILWPLATLYAISYMETTAEKNLPRFFACFHAAIFSSIGVIFAGNLLTMYLFYEILSFVTYPLVAHKQDAEAKQAGRKYLAYIVIPSILFVLPAMIFTYGFTGSLTFQSGGVFSPDQAGLMTTLLAILLIFGFSKSALLPFHSWLPGAMVAPTPVSSLLHAVAVVKVGVFSVLRVVNDIIGREFLLSMNLLGINFQIILLTVAGISVLWPSLVALSQDSLKRRLAFSTIGQLAYISLACFILSPLSNQAGAIHIAMHAFAKITLFFVAGAIYLQFHYKNISQLQGLAYRMPFCFIAWTIASASIVGLPLTGGFISKWYLLNASLDTGYVILPLIFILSSLLSAYYLFEVLFVGLKRDKNFSGVQYYDVNLKCLVPIMLCAFMSIIMFFLAQFLFKYAQSWS